MKRLLGLTTIALIVAFPSRARAEAFEVKVRVLCPGYFKTVAGVTVPNPNLANTVPDLAPCPGIKVVAKDADPDWDDHCGLGYTNLEGKVEFDASCGDFGSRPDVYLEIYAKSVHGWEITQYDWFEAVLGTITAIGTVGVIGDLDDAVTANDKYKVTLDGEKKPRNGQKLDYGTISLGNEGGSVRSRREFVGTLFFMSDLSMRTMQAIGFNSPLLDNTNWVIDSIVGSPTTIWNDIVIDGSERDSANAASAALRAVPHEFGHVFHNKRHSGETHWLVMDAIEYLHNHSSCDKFNEKMGWYEGFANFVRDIVNDSVSTVSNDTDGTGALRHRSLWEPFYIGLAASKCANKSAEIEGNVEAILVDWYFGNYESRDSNLRVTRLQSDLTTHLTQAEPLCGTTLEQMPTWSPKDMMGLIKDARDAKATGRISDNHSLYDYWFAGTYPDRCVGKYCGSKTFSERSGLVLNDRIGFEEINNCKETKPRRVTQKIVPQAAPVVTSAKVAVSDAAKRNLAAEVKRQQKERKAEVPLKAAFQKRAGGRGRRTPDLPDWYEKGISPDHIADTDFAVVPKKKLVPEYTVSPHVMAVAKMQLRAKLGREPKAADLKAFVNEENAKVARLNTALRNSAKLRKALAGRDVKVADDIEDAIVRAEMGIKGDPDEARDPRELGAQERRKQRDGLAAQLINEKYGGAR